MHKRYIGMYWTFVILLLMKIIFAKIIYIVLLPIHNKPPHRVCTMYKYYTNIYLEFVFLYCFIHS